MEKPESHHVINITKQNCDPQTKMAAMHLDSSIQPLYKTNFLVYHRVSMGLYHPIYRIDTLYPPVLPGCLNIIMY